MSRAVTLANFASGEALTVDETNDRVGIASTSPDATLDIKNTILMDGDAGIITATSFSGSGASLSGINASGLTGTPSITIQDIVGVGATFTGAVSIGGTLTYEDVTNVDSVGIVTAGLGLRVLSGGIQAVGLYTGFHASGISTFKGSLGNITAAASGAELKFSRASLNALTATDGSGYFIVQTGGTNERVRVAANGDVTLSGSAAGVSSVTWDASADSLIFKDNSKAIFGDGSDLSIYHDGSTTSYITNSGLIRIRGSEVRLSNTSNETYFTGTSGGSAKVYFNDAVKLETTNTGATITGVTTTTQLAVGPGIIQENLFSEASAATGAGNYDIGTRGLTQYYTANTSGTFTINLRWDGSTALNTKLNVGSSIVFTVYYAQNNTSYYMTDFLIDGASQTEKWVGGTAPSAGGGSGVDCYTFNILKTANATFTVMANQVNFA